MCAPYRQADLAVQQREQCTSEKENGEMQMAVAVGERFSELLRWWAARPLSQLSSFFLSPFHP